MTLALADVCDTDCIASMAPLVLRRMPGRFAFGVDAVLRRILYAWLLPPVLVYDASFGENLLGYRGATLSPGQVLALCGALERAAREEDFVLSASVPVSLDGNALTVPGSVVLVDGRAYPLEVSISQAGAALRALGQ